MSVATNYALQLWDSELQAERALVARQIRYDVRRPPVDRPAAYESSIHTEEVTRAFARAGFGTCTFEGEVLCPSVLRHPTWSLLSLSAPFSVADSLFVIAVHTARDSGWGFYMDGRQLHLQNVAGTWQVTGERSWIQEN